MKKSDSMSPLAVKTQFLFIAITLSITLLTIYLLLTYGLAIDNFKQATTADDVLVGLTNEEWTHLQTLVNEGEYEFVHTKVSDSNLLADVYIAPNYKQGWQAKLSPVGIEVTPRNEGDWAWGLALTGYGDTKGNWRTLADTTPSLQADKNTVTYQWDDNLTEWWVNKANGLEQGFTLQKRPTNLSDIAPLVLEMTIEGDLKPLLQENVISFVDASGNKMLTYDKLYVFDANKQTIPAHFKIAQTTPPRVQIVVDDSQAVYPLTIDPWVQTAKLTASDGAASDEFGNSVAMSGDTIVVGAYKDDDVGSAYVFVRPGSGSWSDATETAKLTASDATAGDWFGYSVDISDDTIVVGAQYHDDIASDSGSAYVYVKPALGWTTATETAKLTASDIIGSGRLGNSVAVDGDTIVVGARVSNAAYVFVEPVSGWITDTETAKLTASDTFGGQGFGSSVAINNDAIVVGTDGYSNSAINAYVYVKPVSGWITDTETAKLTASDAVNGDLFGLSVAVSGGTVVVGAPRDDNGASDSGSAYVFVKPVSGWTNTTETAKLTASDPADNDQFGWGVATNENTIVVGAVLDSSAYIFDKPVSGWITTTGTVKLTAFGSSTLGTSVAMSGNTIVAGDAGEYLGTEPGAAYVFELLTQYTLTTTTNGTGSGSVTLDPAGGTYVDGTVVTVTPNAGIGSTFTGWSGACTGTGVCQITMDANKSVSATFTLNQYALTTATGGTGSGSVTLNPAGGTYDHGTVVTVTQNATIGSTFAGWSGACTGTGACQITMNANKSVSATFTLNAPNQYTLITATTGTGSGSVILNPAGGTYQEGTVVTVTPNASSGSIFAGWSGACTGSGACQIIMNTNKSVTATFTKQDPCTGEALRILLNGSGPVIELDGSCRYEFNDTNAFNNHFINLINKNDLVINGNGATIARGANAGDHGLFLISNSSQLTIRDVTLANGEASSGGAIAIYNSTVTVDNLRLEDNKANYGGAIGSYDNSSLTVISSTFINNTAIYGGAIFGDKSNLAVENSVFANNKATRGSASIHSSIPSGYSTEITHSTFTDNNGNVLDAIGAWGEGTVELTNNIIANHDIGILAGGNVTEHNNLFAGNQIDKRLNGGTVTELGGSISVVDPYFVNPELADYRLQAKSAAVDRGVVTNVTKDKNGKTRPFSNTGIDIGAYEYQGQGIPSLSIMKQAPPWFAPGATITFDIVVSNDSLFDAADLVVTEVLPAGVTYVADSASNGGVFQNNTLTWNIGSLNSGQEIALEYQVTATQTFVSDNYKVVSISNNDVSAIGFAMTTSSNQSLIGDLGFFPRPDGFSFPNYTDSPDSDLDVNDMIFIYGADAVCKTQNPCVLTAAAEQWRKTWLEGVSGGHCAGMAVSSLQLFANPSINPNQFQTNALFTYDLEKPNIRKQIALFATTQALADPTWDIAVKGYPGANGATEVVRILKENLSDQNAADRYTLSFAKEDLTAGHAVTPYAIEDKGNEKYWIYVYDNNYPNTFDRVVKIDLANDVWVYESATTAPGEPVSDYTGTATSRNLAVESLNYAQSFPKVCDVACSTPATRNARTTSEDVFYQFQLDGEGYILVTRNDGKRLGYDLETGEFINEINGAEDILVTTGLGFNIPNVLRVPHQSGATYTIQLANRPMAYGTFEANVDFSIMGPGFVTRLTDLDLNENTDFTFTIPQALPDTNSIWRILNKTKDVVTIQFDPAANGLNIQSSNLDSDTPNVIMAIDNRQGVDYTFQLNDMEIASGERLSVKFDASTAQFLFSDTDITTANVYNFAVERINEDGSKDEYQQKNITNGDGAGSVIDLSNWDGVTAPTITTVADVFNLYLPIVVGK